MIRREMTRDAGAFLTYFLHGDTARASMILNLLKPRARRELAEAFEVAAAFTRKRPRMLSFAMTTEQVRNRTKTVTRRLGWLDLKPGTILQAVEKAQGLKKGEHVKRLCLIRVLSVQREQLCKITRREVAREGFPGMLKHKFVEFFCEGHGCEPADFVTRIEFEYV
jgi:hypothetical protein